MDVVLQVIGWLVYIVGFIWLVIDALGKSIPFGMVSFCISPIALVHGFMNWTELKVPAVMMIVGFVILVIANILKHQ